MTSNAANSGSRVFPPPAKVAAISFLALSAFVTPFLFFVPLPQPGPGIWFGPGLYLYCGLLSVVIAGLLQNNLHVVFALLNLCFFTTICSIVGVQILVLSDGDRDWMAVALMLLRITLYMCYFLFGFIGILSVRGWIIGSRRNTNGKLNSTAG